MNDSATHHISMITADNFVRVVEVTTPAGTQELTKPDFMHCVFTDLTRSQHTSFSRFSIIPHSSPPSSFPFQTSNHILDFWPLVII